MISRLEGSSSCWEVLGPSKAGNVHIATGVHRDAIASITRATTEIGRVSQYRVDDQRPAAIISCYLKADFVRIFELITARDFFPRAVDFLVDARLLQANLAPFHSQNRSEERRVGKECRSRW